MKYLLLLMFKYIRLQVTMNYIRMRTIIKTIFKRLLDIWDSLNLFIFHLLSFYSIINYMPLSSIYNINHIII